MGGNLMVSSQSNGLEWQKDAECAKPENRQLVEFFFSSKADEKYQAKNLCFSCPVRQDCLKWALENRQIWGIWGGRDEGDIRRTLSVSWDGQESRRRRFPQCPFCTARPSKLETFMKDVPGGGRWATMKMVRCTSCDFTWRSRTSANAVEAYHAQRNDKLEKQAAERLKKKVAAEAKKAKEKPKKSS